MHLYFTLFCLPMLAFFLCLSPHLPADWLPLLEYFQFFTLQYWSDFMRLLLWLYYINNPALKWVWFSYWYICCMFMFQDREWFAGDCNRKTAEDLLQRINKVNLVVLKWYKKNNDDMSRWHSNIKLKRKLNLSQTASGLHGSDLFSISSTYSPWCMWSFFTFPLFIPRFIHLSVLVVACLTMLSYLSRFPKMFFYI